MVINEKETKTKTKTKISAFIIHPILQFSLLIVFPEE
jgi:hypothetical protein